ncbi:MAG: hypothetical protein ACK4FW_11015 [Stenotrophomonas sp.]
MQHRHSGLGIASFILSLGGGGLLFLLIVVAGYAEMSTPGGLDESAPSTMLLGLAILGAGVLEVVAVGLVCAVGTLLGTAGLMVLGAMG